MNTKKEVIAAFDALETQVKDAISDIGAVPSATGHHRELDQAMYRLEESVMWMRRAVDRIFA